MLTRQKVEAVLTGAGVPVGHYEDGTVASLVDYVDYWGIIPGIPGTPAVQSSVIAALDAAGVRWKMGNLVQVLKHQDDPS